MVPIAFQKSKIRVQSYLIIHQSQQSDSSQVNQIEKQNESVDISNQSYYSDINAKHTILRWIYKVFDNKNESNIYSIL
ncbi:unnamed protein product [Paramecium primaurelia]|uniref:Uncharacterized protein n=1 Tax=Paramecium primaurelia TaxID=5886 RepID=A0A8S1QM08_PARPR|nr:unnamed protein product [Paramecium primaurelia]